MPTHIESATTLSDMYVYKYSVDIIFIVYDKG